MFLNSKHIQTSQIEPQTLKMLNSGTLNSNHLQTFQVCPQTSKMLNSDAFEL